MVREVTLNDSRRMIRVFLVIIVINIKPIPGEQAETQQSRSLFDQDNYVGVKPTEVSQTDFQSSDRVVYKPDASYQPLSVL